MTTQTAMSLCLTAGDQQKDIRDKLPLEKTQPGGTVLAVLNAYSFRSVNHCML